MAGEIEKALKKFSQDLANDLVKLAKSNVQGRGLVGKTSKLINSIKGRVELRNDEFRVVVGSNLVYPNILNRGGNVKQSPYHKGDAELKYPRRRRLKLKRRFQLKARPFMNKEIATAFLSKSTKNLNTELKSAIEKRIKLIKL